MFKKRIKSEGWLEEGRTFSIRNRRKNWRDKTRMNLSNKRTKNRRSEIEKPWIDKNGMSYNITKDQMS